MEVTWDFDKVEATSKLKWQQDLLTNAQRGIRKLMDSLPPSLRANLAVLLTQTEASLTITGEVMKDLAQREQTA
ncbi:MAG: hypothetical protein EB023_13145 [Flavobacteriia bacterium]|nr:hypothetical protein [Flavobacteriia bacterium]